MKVLDNENETRDKTSLYGLGVTKGESGGIYMMLKMEWKWHNIIVF